MRKSKSKLTGILLSCLVACSFNAFAGWQNENGFWTYINDQGQRVVNNWVFDNGAVYFMNQNGIMKTMMNLFNRFWSIQTNTVKKMDVHPLNFQMNCVNMQI